MIIIHVLEPFASGVTTAVISITQQLPNMKHLIVHGSRMWVDDIESVKQRFPPYVEFIDWPYVKREISVLRDGRALRSLMKILREVVPALAQKDKKALNSSAKNYVVHLHSSKAGFLGRLACRLLGLKNVIYTPHGASFIRTDIGNSQRWFFRALEKLGGSFCGTVVGCGESEAALYSSLGKKALFVANGVPITPLAQTESRDLITFAGIASIQKNPGLFNKIAASISAPFAWVGDGPRRAALASPNIAVIGWADKATLNSYLSRTLVYLSAALWEGLPFGVIEAMDAGCALLLHDVPGNRDLVRQGENGYLFQDEAEAIALLKKLLGNREATLSMGRKSHELAESEYSVEKMGEGYRNIYEKIGGGGGILGVKI
jgi:glycosyltransferase involved in cell wall biosynthesis